MKFISDGFKKISEIKSDSDKIIQILKFTAENSPAGFKEWMDYCATKISSGELFDAEHLNM